MRLVLLVSYLAATFCGSAGFVVPHVAPMLRAISSWQQAATEVPSASHLCTGRHVRLRVVGTRVVLTATA